MNDNDDLVGLTDRFLGLCAVCLITEVNDEIVVIFTLVQPARNRRMVRRCIKEAARHFGAIKK